MDRTIAIGTLIHGTLRDEDLLPAFADELERVGEAGAHAELIQRANRVHAKLYRDDHDGNYDVSTETVHDLMDALQDYAPVHMYFGNTSDGSDFGWWPVTEYDCETVRIDDENVIDVECNIHINVNDHGNVTVSELRGAVIWAAV